VGSINLSRSEAKMKGGKNRTSAGSDPPEEKLATPFHSSDHWTSMENDVGI
jgi:hypothetical protein